MCTSGHRMRWSLHHDPCGAAHPGKFQLFTPFQSRLCCHPGLQQTQGSAGQNVFAMPAKWPEMACSQNGLVHQKGWRHRSPSRLAADKGEGEGVHHFTQPGNHTNASETFKKKHGGDFLKNEDFNKALLSHQQCSGLTAAALGC